MDIEYYKLITEERTTSAPYGCLMALVEGSAAQKILNVNKRIVNDNILYTEGTEYGREKEPHTTIKYGFQPDLNELEIRQLLKGIKPFTIKLIGLSTFDGEKYDVVKFDVQSSVLSDLHEKCNAFPNHDEHPIYHPHLTLAYVQKKSFSAKRENLQLSIPIETIYYSSPRGEKSYFKLS